jgi:hypothetical protein
VREIICAGMRKKVIKGTIAVPFPDTSSIPRRCAKSEAAADKEAL